jgi:hypothetical protein
LKKWAEHAEEHERELQQTLGTASVILFRAQDFITPDLERSPTDDPA